MLKYIQFTLLIVGTNFSRFVTCCLRQVLILADQLLFVGAYFGGFCTSLLNLPKQSPIQEWIHVDLSWANLFQGQKNGY